jgi:hypothetical protein
MQSSRVFCRNDAIPGARGQIDRPRKITASPRRIRPQGANPREASIPDAQVMHIRLKVAVIDVRSGHCSMFAPDAHTDASFSAERSRAASDQRQVQVLKAQAD